MENQPGREHAYRQVNGKTISSNVNWNGKLELDTLHCFSCGRQTAIWMDEAGNKVRRAECGRDHKKSDYSCLPCSLTLSLLALVAVLFIRSPLPILFRSPRRPSRIR